MAKKKNAEGQAGIILLEVPTDSDLSVRIGKISEQTGLLPLSLFQKWVLQEESLIGVLQGNQKRLSEQVETRPAAQEKSAKADVPVSAPDGSGYRKKLVKRVMKLKKEGMTLKRIAETFNEENVPTISGIGKWYGSSIANLLKPKI